MESERRSGPRYLFIAETEVVDRTSDAKCAARTNELSISGCFIETRNPAPAGTELWIRISLGRLIARAAAFPTRVWYEITAPSSLPLEINCTSLTCDDKSMREIEPEGLPSISAPHGHRRVSPLAFGVSLPDSRPAA